MKKICILFILFEVIFCMNLLCNKVNAMSLPEIDLEKLNEAKDSVVNNLKNGIEIINQNIQNIDKEEITNNIKNKIDEVSENLNGKKEEFKEKAENIKDNLAGKQEEFKEKVENIKDSLNENPEFKEKVENIKQNFNEKKEEITEKINQKNDKKVSFVDQIINKIFKKTASEKTETTDNAKAEIITAVSETSTYPQTGDNIVIWLGIIVACTCGIILLKIVK